MQLRKNGWRRPQVAPSLGAALLGGLAACTPGADQRALPASGLDGGTNLRFAHGVASGDPLEDRVVVWTRVSHDDDTAVAVDWALARDEAMREVVQRGTVMATAERDFTIKVDVAHLSPGTTYYYQFSAHDESRAQSEVGRTHTLPESTERVRLAVVSCSAYSAGFFAAYGDIATRDVDAVVHLGDYLYEVGPEVARYNASGIGRDALPPHELITLDDYRTRYAQYHSDPDLQAMRATHPLIAIWDDHEVADDVWNEGAVAHGPEDGDFAARRAAAIEAYAEWMPVRERVRDGKLSLYRSHAFGELVDLILVDTRLEDRDAPGAGAPAPASSSLLGEAQEAWLHAQLSASQTRGASWRLLGSQVMMAQLDVPGFDLDLVAWDGYPAVRTRLFDHLESNRIGDVVVLSGDAHTAAAMELVRDPFDESYAKTGEGTLAVELMTTSVSAPPVARLLNANGPEVVADSHPHFKLLDVDVRGYMLVEVDATQVQAEWYGVDDLLAPQGELTRVHTARVVAGSAHVLVDE